MSNPPPPPKSTKDVDSPNSSLVQTSQPPPSLDAVSNDKLLYTWSTFFSILTNTATPTTKASYFRHRDDLNEAADCARCDAQKAWLFQNSPVVRFMRHNINLLGQDINEDNVRCRRCETAQSGGFDPEYGIMVCANVLRNKGHLEDTMAHEMVHAWDYLRFKYNDPRDLRHAACTEVSLVIRRTGKEGYLVGGDRGLMWLCRFARRRFRVSVGSAGSLLPEASSTSRSSCRNVSGGVLRCRLRTDRAVRIRRMRQGW